MSPILCEKIKYYLLKQVKKPEPKEKKYNFDFNVKENKNYISNEEERKIKKEILDVFDLRDTIKRDLSYSEVLYYVDLMKKISIEEKIIKRFLKRFDEQDRKRNPITRYLELRDKLMFYKDKYAINDLIENMDDYLNELLSLNQGEDFNESYDYWEDAIEEELNKALSYIPKDYNYELGQVK